MVELERRIPVMIGSAINANANTNAIVT